MSDLTQMPTDQLLAMLNSHPDVPQLKGDLGHQAAAGLLAFGQGGMPIFDEAGAAAGAGLQKAGLIDGPSGDSLGDIYDKRLQNIRNVEKSFSQQHQVIDPALRIAGGVAATAPLAATMAARPVLSGAAYGLAQGVTGSEGGADNRIAGGALGALLGGATSYAANKIANALRSPGPLKPSESGVIAKNLELGGVTPQDYAAALRNSSSDDFAGELGGEPLRQLTQNQAKIASPAMQTARDAMRERLATAPQRAAGIVSDALGSPEDSNALMSALDIAKGAEGKLYGSVEGTVPASQFSDVINTPAGQKALQQTAENLANARVDPIEAGFTRIAKPNGEEAYALADNVPVSTWHEISKAIGDQVERNPINGKIETNASGNIEGLRKQIVDALRNNSPEFNAAQDNAAQVRSAQDAYDLGRKLAGMATGENANDALSAALRKEEITPFSQAGFRQGLIDKTQDVALGTGNPVAPIAKVRTISRASEFVGPQGADKLKNALIAEKLRLDLANRGLYGSNTAETLVGGGFYSIPTSAKDAVGKAVGAISDKLSEASKRRLADALYAMSPDEKSAIARSVLSYGRAVPVMDSNLAQGIRNQVPYIPIQTYGAFSGDQR